MRCTTFTASTRASRCVASRFPGRFLRRSSSRRHSPIAKSPRAISDRTAAISRSPNVLLNRARSIHVRSGVVSLSGPTSATSSWSITTSRTLIHRAARCAIRASSAVQNSCRLGGVFSAPHTQAAVCCSAMRRGFSPTPRDSARRNAVSGRSTGANPRSRAKSSPSRRAARSSASGRSVVERTEGSCGVICSASLQARHALSFEDAAVDFDALWRIERTSWKLPMPATGASCSERPTTPCARLGPLAPR